MLGLRTQFLVFKDDMTIADEVKFHFFQTQKLMEKLVTLAKVDATIAKGVANFFGEAGFNFVNMVVENAHKLPKEARDEIPFIKLAADIESEVDSATNREDSNGSLVPA